MLGRHVTAAFRRPLQARLRVATAPQSQLNLCIRTFSYAPRLLEAAGRPRKAVGEPSRPVKRAVKKAAKKPAVSKEDAAARKVAEKEKKRLAKEKERKKKAADAKKAKQLAMTPEQVEKKKASLLKAEAKELRKAALNPPFPNARMNAYTAFTRERSKKVYASTSSTEEGRAGVQSRIVQLARENAAAWKEISASDLEHYNHIVHTEKEAANAEYKRWIDSHSLEEIKLANVARRALQRQLKSAGRSLSSRWREIVDERVPKKAMTAYIAFFTSRNGSGDFRNIAVTERAKLISQEWKALSTDEKKKFENISEQDRQRYLAEVKSLSSSSPAPTA